MIGHMCTDINQGGLPAVLPFLIAVHGYSYTEVATLVFITNLLSAIIQPLFGWLGDRANKPWTMALGVLLAGTGLSVLGFVSSNYPAMLLCACVSGTGVALFHPEGGNIANAAGRGKASEMSIFSVGGNIGFTIGPIIAAAAVTAFGLHGLAIFFIPCAICALWIFSNNRELVELEHNRIVTAKQEGGRDHVGAFSLVAVICALRSIVHYAATTFVPLFFVSVLMQPESVGSLGISIVSIMGVIAMLLGGSMGDKVGLIKFIRVAYLVLIPACFVMGVSTNAIVCVICVALMGFGMDYGYPATTTLGQLFMPQHVGMASGIIFGIAVSVGGITAPLLGMIGDNVGLPAIFTVLGVASVVLCMLTLLVPHPDKN